MRRNLKPYVKALKNFFIPLLFISLFFISCAVTKKEEWPKVSESSLSESSLREGTQFNRGNNNTVKRHFKRSLFQSHRLSQKLKENSKAKEDGLNGEERDLGSLKEFSFKDLGLELLSKGKAYFKERRFGLAYKQFAFIFKSKRESPLKGEALFWAIHSLERLSLYTEALALVDKALSHKELSQGVASFQFYELRFSLLSKLGFHIEAFYVAHYLSSESKKESVSRFYRERVLEYIQNLNQKDLKRVLRDYKFKSVHSYAYYRLAHFYMSQKNFRKAKYYFEKVQRLALESSLLDKASNFIKRILDQETVHPYSIGVILPLSGKHSELSKKILHGLQMGFGIYGEEGSSPFQIAVIDSFGNPDIASRAVERLLSEDKIIALVGSLLSRTSESTAMKANDLGIPSISLSQKLGLTQVGPYIFRNALTSKMQIQTLVRTLIEEKGFKRFALLFPNDLYGLEYVNLFWDEVRYWGGSITSAQIYKSGETDFKNSIQRLVGLYYIEDREKEYQSLITDWIEKQRIISIRKSPPDNILRPIVNFDAIFVPDGVKAIGQIAPMLAYYEIEDVRLVGTSLWNSSSLVKRGQKHVEGALFVDNNLNLLKNKSGQKFFRQYKKVFGEEPNVFSKRAYDIAKILRFFIEKGERTRIGLREKIAELKEFKGISGSLHMTDQRELSQDTLIFTVSKGQIVSVDSKK